jgi:hypothetical protein
MIPTTLSLLLPPRRAIRQLLSIRIVKQRLRRLTDIDEIVLPLTARELIIGEVAGAHRRRHPVTLLVVAQRVSCAMQFTPHAADGRAAYVPSRLQGSR